MLGKIPFGNSKQLLRKLQKISKDTLIAAPCICRHDCRNQLAAVMLCVFTVAERSLKILRPLSSPRVAYYFMTPHRSTLCCNNGASYWISVD